MIPEFELETGCLPPGRHQANWFEILERFGYTGRRKDLLRGLLKAIIFLKNDFNCTTIFIDGDFVTDKRNPGHYNIVWDDTGINLEKCFQICSTFFTFKAECATQKKEFFGTFHPKSDFEPDIHIPYLEYYQMDTRVGTDKGIIELDISKMNITLNSTEYDPE